MEKNIRTSHIDIVIKAQKDSLVFEIKDPKKLNKALMDDVKKEFFVIQNDSVVIYPEQKIVDTQGVFLENTSKII
jgi:hypothetical protein